MFKIQEKYFEKGIYTVYDTYKVFDLPYFLIFYKNKWEWVSGRNYVPYEENNKEG